MSSLREQFEAWLKKEHPSVASGFNDFADYEEDLAWQSYQAGHAANTVNAELLEALESMLGAVETMTCPQNIDDVAMLVIRFASRIDQSRAAIKKARGEA